MKVESDRGFHDVEPNSDDREQPPPAAERFVWGFRSHRAYYQEEWADDPHFEPPDGVEPSDRISFDKGDTLPRALVEDVWHAFGARIIAFDANENVIDGVDSHPHRGGFE